MTSRVRDRGRSPYVIGLANIDPNLAGSEIEFDPAVFAASTPQMITLGSDLELSETAGPEVIDGPGAAVFTVSSNDDGRGRVFLVDTGVTATLRGLTITNGVAEIDEDEESPDENSGNGGGIFNEGTLTVDTCTVTQNAATGNGGGIFNTGTLMVIGGEITDNFALFTGGSGGGIYNSGGTGKSAEVARF